MANIVARLALLFGLLMPFGLGAQSTKTLTVLVVPQYAETRIYSTWQPILQSAAQKLGVQFELLLSQDIPTFEKEILAGRADIIFCNPYHMLIAKQKQGYMPFVRDSNSMRGLLLAAQDGQVNSLKDLEGQTLLFPAPNAFGASLYMRALLTEKEKLQFTPKYVKTHPNVMRGILRGEGAAGGTVTTAMGTENESIEAKLKVVYETPPTAPHPLAVHARVAEPLRKRLAQAFIDAILQHPHSAINIPMPNPVPSQYETDYKPLEKLRLERYAAP